MTEAKKKSRKKKIASTATLKKVASESRAKAKKDAEVLKERMSESRLAGFVDFIREQGIVGLAVGLAIGTAAGDTVKKLVEGFITPIVQLIIGSQKGLEAATWHVELFGRSGDFKWGAFVSSFITLAATAFVIYLIIHVAKLDQLDRKKE